MSLKTIYYENEEEIECKTQLVAKGLAQKLGTDYDDTFLLLSNIQLLDLFFLVTYQKAHFKYMLKQLI